MESHTVEFLSFIRLWKVFVAIQTENVDDAKNDLIVEVSFLINCKMYQKALISRDFLRSMRSIHYFGPPRVFAD
jgi:hypothetical protein